MGVLWYDELFHRHCHLHVDSGLAEVSQNAESRPIIDFHESEGAAKALATFAVAWAQI